jgi:hypothetical protein
MGPIYELIRMASSTYSYPATNIDISVHAPKTADSLLTTIHSLSNQFDTSGMFFIDVGSGKNQFLMLNRSELKYEK